MSIEVKRAKFNGIIDPTTHSFRMEDMENARIQGAGETQAITANSGTNAKGTSFKNHPGVRLCSTLTSTDSLSGEYSNMEWQLNKTLGAYFACTINLPALSDATDEYVVRMGLAADINKANISAPTHGIYFKYDRALLGTSWQLCTSNGSVETATTSSTVVSAAAAAATTYQTFEWKLAPGGASVEYFINGVSVGTNASTIPDETDTLYPQVIMVRTAGTTARTMNIDMISWDIRVDR
jgi:hypothetical protein